MTTKQRATDAVVPRAVAVATLALWNPGFGSDPGTRKPCFPPHAPRPLPDAPCPMPPALTYGFASGVAGSGAAGSGAPASGDGGGAAPAAWNLTPAAIAYAWSR